MEDKLYWLWFTLKNITSRKQFELFEIFGSPKEIYDTENYGGISLPSPTVKMLKDKSLDEAIKVYNKIEELGGYILVYSDEEYPLTLKQISVPPLVLYCKGTHPDWDKSFKITVVGTRNYNDYGRIATDKIVRELSEYKNTLIVTGMARGIDAIANCAAIRAGGRTVAVLGSGLDVIYPPEYKGLYNSITKNGVVITEFPPGTPPLRQNFPRRNRIMAGICEAVLIGQAPARSGSLITAAHAISYGIENFVIPGRITDKGFEGSNELISRGAKLVTCAEDILESFPYMEFEKVETKKQPQRKAESKTVNLDGLNGTERKLVELLCAGNLHVYDLARTAGITSPETNSALVMLELSGIVKKLDGNVYALYEETEREHGKE